MPGNKPPLSFTESYPLLAFTPCKIKLLWKAENCYSPKRITVGSEYYYAFFQKNWTQFKFNHHLMIKLCFILDIIYYFIYFRVKCFHFLSICWYSNAIWAKALNCLCWKIRNLKRQKFELVSPFQANQLITTVWGLCWNFSLSFVNKFNLSRQAYFLHCVIRMNPVCSLCKSIWGLGYIKHIRMTCFAKIFRNNCKTTSTLYIFGSELDMCLTVASETR